MKKNAFFALLALLLFAIAAPLHATNISLYQLEAQNTDPDTAKLVTALLRSELAMAAGQDVTMPEETCYEVDCAKAALLQTDADLVVTGKLLQFSESYSLYVSAVWNVETHIYRVILDEIDEISRLAPRLATAIVNKETFEEAITVTTVSKAEQELHIREEGDFSWGPSLGVLVPVGGSYGGADLLYTVDLSFRYEMAKIGIQFDNGVYFHYGEEGDDGVAYEFAWDFLGMYYFSERRHSPFIGGSLGLHHIGIVANRNKESDDEVRENGWTGSAAVFAGYEFFRTQSLHFLVKAGYRTGFLALNGAGAHGAYMTLGLTF